MRIYFSILILILAADQIRAQRNLFNLCVGYALPLGGNSMIEKVINESSGTLTGRKFNLGSGANLQFRTDHFFRTSMAVEFAFAYRFHYSRFFSSEKASYTTTSTEERETIETNKFYIPQLSSGIYMHSEGKRKLFLRSGLNIGLFPVLINDYTEEKKNDQQFSYHIAKRT